MVVIYFSEFASYKKNLSTLVFWSSDKTNFTRDYFSFERSTIGRRLKFICTFKVQMFILIHSSNDLAINFSTKLFLHSRKLGTLGKVMTHPLCSSEKALNSKETPQSAQISFVLILPIDLPVFQFHRLCIVIFILNDMLKWAKLILLGNWCD